MKVSTMQGNNYKRRKEGGGLLGERRQTRAATRAKVSHVGMGMMELRGSRRTNGRKTGARVATVSGGEEEMDPPSQLGREPRCPEFQKATSALLHVRCSAATACVQRAACKEQGAAAPADWLQWLARAPERALGPTCSPSAARAGRQRTFAVNQLYGVHVPTSYNAYGPFCFWYHGTNQDAQGRASGPAPISKQRPCHWSGNDDT